MHLKYAISTKDVLTFEDYIVNTMTLIPEPLNRLLLRKQDLHKTLNVPSPELKSSNLYLQSYDLLSAAGCCIYILYNVHILIGLNHFNSVCSSIPDQHVL